MSLPQPSQPALPPAPGLPLSPHSLPDCSSPPHWLQQTDRLDDASFQPSDFTQPDLHVDDSLQPMDHPHHPPVAAPSQNSHVGGASVQDLLFPPGHFKTKEEKEDWARAPKASTLASPVISLPHGTPPAVDTETKQDNALTSPLNPSPDSELYWSPWLYSDIVIADHPSGNSALTCSLPPFPHCPGTLLASDPPPVHRHVLCLRARAPSSSIHLPGSTRSRSPQLQRSPPASTTQAQHPSLERSVPPLPRRLISGLARIRVSHRIHSSSSSSPAHRQPSFGHPVPGRHRCLPQTGAPTLYHHRAG